MTSGDKKVLLVDDDADFRDATRHILESKGFVVIEAPNGAKGLRAAREEGPDVVLIDVIMDTYSEGFDLVRQLATDPRTAPIPRIIISSLRILQEVDTVHPEELGTIHILRKPVAPGELVEAVDNAIAAGKGSAGTRSVEGG